MQQENGERIFVGEPAAGIIRLGEEEASHCVKVLRHREGDVISVIDGLGTLYRCRILNASSSGVEAEIIGSVTHFGTHPYRLTMAVCPTKNTDRYEWFVEKATEIGVDVIVPVIGDRSERRVIKTDRMRKIVLSAVKQSLKGAIPQVCESISVKQFINGTGSDGIKLICYCIDNEELRRNITEVLASTDPKSDITILVGPEGDFTAEEVDLALEKGWVPVHLGQSRLRTETAAVVAATAVYLCR
ncbi:MAG: 16S rRNA (uracil(1498)-N(3))-methyltransferase [Bacteroidales bacterium]|nr:16S rRNA (uracil(1498)-N(3))-methyltransferase [Bacteroidales bacterium]